MIITDLLMKAEQNMIEVQRVKHKHDQKNSSRYNDFDSEDDET